MSETFVLRDSEKPNFFPSRQHNNKSIYVECIFQDGTKNGLRYIYKA